jgi:hypothetical protein
LATITKPEAASGLAEGLPIGEDPTLPLRRQLDELEKRVQQLEGQDTKALEERIASRVADRLSPAPAPPAQAAGLLEAGRRPAALGGRRKAAGSSHRQGWLIPDLYAEVRAIFWMFLDTRYRLGWTCRLIPPILVSVLFISWFLLDGRLFYVGTIMDRVIEIALVVIAYKILSREARRYRDTVGDFPSKHAA